MTNCGNLCGSDQAQRPHNTDSSDSQANNKLLPGKKRKPSCVTNTRPPIYKKETTILHIAGGVLGTQKKRIRGRPEKDIVGRCANRIHVRHQRNKNLKRNKKSEQINKQRDETEMKTKEDACPAFTEHAKQSYKKRQTQNVQNGNNYGVLHVTK